MGSCISEHNEKVTVYSSITNSNGIAVANVTISETSNIYAHFDEITTKYPSSNSNAINVEYRDSPYQYCEWIEATGTQYIDTGYTTTENTKIQMRYQTTTGYINEYAVCGYMWSATSLFLMVYEGKYRGHSHGVGTDITTDITAVHDIEYTPTYLKVDNIQQSISGSSSNSHGVLRIFNTITQQSYTNKGHGKLYGMKIYDNDVLVRDFKPCYNIDTGVIGLYDTVNNVFYTNKGTGVFIKGADVN